MVTPVGELCSIAMIAAAPSASETSLSISIAGSNTPSECSDVIRRAHVRRNREQQAAATQPRWWVDSAPLRGVKQPTSILEQILGKEGGFWPFSTIFKTSAKSDAEMPCKADQNIKNVWNEVVNKCARGAGMKYWHGTSMPISEGCKPCCLLRSAYCSATCIALIDCMDCCLPCEPISSSSQAATLAIGIDGGTPPSGNPTCTIRPPRLKERMVQWFRRYVYIRTHLHLSTVYTMQYRTDFNQGQKENEEKADDAKRRQRRQKRGGVGWLGGGGFGGSLFVRVDLPCTPYRILAS